MNRGTRLAIVAGIIIAIAGTAAFLAVSSAPPSEPASSTDNESSTEDGSRQITVELSENLSMEAK